MDTLRLNGLKFRGLHGVFEEERISGNDFEIDIIIQASLQEAAISDDLEKTIDYQRVFGAVKSVMEGPSKQLIEHLAFLIGERIVELTSANTKFSVTVKKLSPPLPGIIQSSEVTLSWPR